ncbi:MAG: InlB B-repeat-containing protein, partial [Spirochaetes bacterium]|nr:InlB B-repeat-containing protein [Spirochaetota bacterium]
DPAGTTIHLQVPVGAARTITVTAIDSDGNALYRKSGVVPVYARKENALSLRLDGVEYTISFDSNGGTGTMAPLSIPFGTTATLPANGFSRADHLFGGWIDSSASSALHADLAGYSMGPANATLYAVWIPNAIPGQYIQGDGSGGGGGGASGAFLGGDGGAGGGGDDTISCTEGNDIVFGDGSGGGKGGRGVGQDDYTGLGAGPGGGGADSIDGGAGDDIIFGDGFDGTMDIWHSGRGGFGGGGGGGSGGNLATYLGATGGLGAGGGSGYAGSVEPLIAGFGNTGGSETTPGGASATSIALATGPGGASYGSAGNGYGGGGGFGGSSGGAGASGAGPGNVGGDGNIAEHRYDDSTGAIHGYVAGRLGTILTDYPAYGAGADTLDGGPGSDHLFGLGGNDVFVFRLDDAVNGNDIDTIWDFDRNAETDRLRLLISGVAISAPARAALILAQVAEGADRRIVFSDGAGKRVTIIIKDLGRDVAAADFE